MTADALRRHWTLDPDVTFLNHGSYGACPAPVLALQAELRAELEREPVQFLGHVARERLHDARAELARFLGADAADVAFVPNATTGVNSVLRSLRFEPGDEILVTDHAYNACRNAVDFVAERWGARVVVAAVPFPLSGADEVVAAVTGAVSAKTRLAMIDHVTSPTALVFPVEAIARELAARDVEVLVDGAHAPGMVEVDLSALERAGVTYYAGNCHKWLCAPKGAGFLWVRRERQGSIRPVVISHGANAPLADRSRFHVEFDWVGAIDLTPWLCTPAAIDFVGSLLDGGWPAVRARNHALALEARDVLCDVLEVDPPCPDEMVGSMAAIPLAREAGAPWPDRSEADALGAELFERFRIEVPVMRWPSPPLRVLRVSAQLYNTRADFEALAAALREAREL